MIRIKSFAKTKGTTGTGGYSISPTVLPSGTQLETHTFWGQPYNGTQDVEGDLNNVGNINATGTISGNTVIANNISGTSANVSDLIATQAVIGTLSATTADFTNMSAISGYIQSLLSEDIVVDNLTVTKAAHFFKLIIDEIKSTQGQIIITPANGVIDHVDEMDNTPYGNKAYFCYFRCEDGDKQISNQFEVGDLVVCQTFNAATGTSYDVSNRYYWMHCVETGYTEDTVSGETNEYYYILLLDDDKDSHSNATPQADDNVVQLGNLTDTDRQAAIIISSYNNQFLDGGLEAPSIAQYTGINEYNLSRHRQNVISKLYNYFTGNFVSTAGDNLSDSISQLKQTTSAITTTVTQLQNDVEEISGTKALIDLTDCDDTKLYPIGIGIGNAGSEEVRCQVRRTLYQSYGVPSYARHQNGFTVLLDWNTRAGGWGTNEVNERWSTNDPTRYINAFSVGWTVNDDKRVAGSIAQDFRGSTEIVYLRGGSKYDVSTTADALILAYKNGYHMGYDEQGTTVLVDFDPINYSAVTLPVQDTMIKSQIIQTADNIKLEVISGLTNTGIDISQGKINLAANKVTFSDSNGGNKDKITIDPTTGTLNAVNGNFTNGTYSGLLKANMLYVPTLNYLTTDDYIITVDKESSTSFYIECDDENDRSHFTLPTAANYNGLELTFYYNKTNNAVPPIIMVRDGEPYITFRPSTSFYVADIDPSWPADLIVEWQTKDLKNKPRVMIFPNQEVKFKAMNNRWFVMYGYVADGGNM